METRGPARLVLAAGAVLALLSIGSGTSQASTLVSQVWLPGECIPQFATPLPVFGPGYNAALPRVDALRHPFLTVTMKEAERQVLPVFTPAAGCPAVSIKPTRVWAYETRDSVSGNLLGPAFWPAVTVEARRFVPAFVKYVNELPSFNALDPQKQVQGLVTVDQTLHWADPLGTCMEPTNSGCDQPFVGPPPAVAHLHGGEVPSAFDGGPEAWFTPDGRTGSAYRTLGHPGPGKAIYWYPNFQEAGTPWFHDHALGATRTNVYSGLAAFYFMRDPSNEPKRLPEGAYEIEMAIQDRQFDTESQLLFADGSGPEEADLNGPPPNEDVHPFWIPESIGDVVVVNGSPWPFLKVEPRRYRFRLVDGSNARFYNLSFGSAPVYVIGTDDGYLDAPVKVARVLFAPGQRLDLIVDFTKLKGNVVTVTNDAPVPFPSGLVPGVDQPTMANVMQFQVTLPLRGTDRSCNPAAGGCKRPDKMVRLTDGRGNLAAGVRIDKVRQLTLKETIGFEGDSETGPLEVLVNNTKWDGMESPGIAAEFAATDGVSELPRMGSTELWEIINLTMDAHPMHTHLAQFQILSRQAYTDEYPEVWADAFTGNCTAGPDPSNPCPGYGPPNEYNLPNADGAVGGNPAVGPYLLAASRRAPAPEEAGWNDTAIAMPGEVLRMVVRFAPTYTPVSLARAGRNFYPFDPTVGPGYVWHCHIVDHEDNEMMRPYLLAK